MSRRNRIPPNLSEAERAASEEAERFEQAHPDDALRRREFLVKTAAFAGAAGLAATLPGETLIGEAAKVQSRAAKLPSPRNMPIDTFVVLMMENRSFDHYFGWHPDADAKNAGLSFPDAGGQPGFDPPPHPRLAGLRLPRPQPLLGRRPPPVRGRQDERLRPGQRGGHRLGRATRPATTSRRTSASSHAPARSSSCTTASSAR